MSYRSNRKRATLLILRGLGAMILGVALCMLVAQVAGESGGTLLVGGVPIGLLFLAGGLVKGIADIWRGLELLGVASRIDGAFRTFENVVETGGQLVLHTGLGLLIFGALGFLAMLLFGCSIAVTTPQLRDSDRLVGFIILLPLLGSWLGFSAYLGCLGWQSSRLHWMLKAILVILLIPLLVGLYWIGRGGVALVNRIRR